MPARSQYKFRGALRLFSLAVALVSCGLGIRLGWESTNPQYLLAVCVLLGGILAQTGINLINDTEDLQQDDTGSIDEQATKRILQNQSVGWLAFALAALIGLYLVSLRGWLLFWVFSGSAILALNYNAGPLNFKHHGIAFIQVFLLMGIIMIQASYFVLSGEFSTRVAWHSLPVSLLISLLLLSNEIRDYESDLKDRTRTLSVRIGLPAARRFYWALIAAAFSLTLVYAYLEWVNWSRFAWLLPTIFMLPQLNKHLYSNDRQRLTPLSGRFFLAFGAAYIIMVSV
jgi:1,4-dihydroxy-2-naphthoate octaprenyltransferase